MTEKSFYDIPLPHKRRKKFETNSFIPERREWQIVQRAPIERMRGVKVDGKPLPFNMKNRSFTTDDAGLAQAIHDSSGQGGTGNVLVIPTEKPKEPDHSRTFTVTISFDEEGRIIR